MAWNEPGKSNNDNPDPWGGRKKPAGPPDLDKLISDFFKKVTAFFGGKTPVSLSPKLPFGSHKGFGMGAGLVAIVLVVLWFLSGFFIVNPAEQAVILQLGRYVTTMDPGLHWIPRFIDSKYLVDTQRIYSFAFKGDFLTKSSDASDFRSQLNTSNLDKQVIFTANNAGSSEPQGKAKNLIFVELSVQYRVNNARNYLFNIVDADQTIQQAAVSALSDVTGEMKVDEVLTVGRELLASGTRDRVQQILTGYNSGLQVIGVTLRSAQAPEEVRAAFNDVTRAEQDRQTYRQQAEGYWSQVVPLARGDAARTLADATAYSQKIVLTSEANVATYNALVKVYQTAPAITRERMYLDTIQSMLTNTTKVLVSGNANNNLLYLPLDKLVHTRQQPNLLKTSEVTTIKDPSRPEPNKGSN